MKMRNIYKIKLQFSRREYGIIKILQQYEKNKKITVKKTWIKKIIPQMNK